MHVHVRISVLTEKRFICQASGFHAWHESFNQRRSRIIRRFMTGLHVHGPFNVDLRLQAFRGSAEKMFTIF